jgi:CDP-diacylglycerol--glycerol-3-phosphate 3-phosphatidyltransferase
MNLAEAAKSEPVTLTDQLRIRFKGVLDPIAEVLNGLGIYPNTMTIIGLIGNIIGAFFLSQGQLIVGGLFIIAMGPVDALDGTMARLRGESGVYGAFVDSVTDRYSELIILGGLLIYFLSQNAWLAVAVTYAAAVGSILVSYIRARAQSLGHEAKVGIFTRLERYLVLAPLLVFNQPLLAVAIIAVGANITALQRIAHIRREVLRGK